MVIRVLVAVFITIALCYLPGLQESSIRNSVEDNSKKNTVTLLDRKLVEWYYNHGGTLPDNITDANILRAVGVIDLDLKDITYQKDAGSGKSFTLVASMSDGTLFSSLHSGKELNDVEPDKL